MKAPKHSFEFQSPVSLLEKAKRELIRLTDADDPFDENTFISDHGFNFAITTWHISDWVWKLYNPNNSRNMSTLDITKFHEFHSLIRSESNALAICFEIATGSKHLKLDKKCDYIPRIQDTRASLGPITAMALPSFKVLKIELANGELRRADEVFAEAITYWEEFFAKYNIT